MKPTKSMSSLRPVTAKPSSGGASTSTPSQQQGASKKFPRLEFLYTLKNPRDKYTQSTSKLESRLLDNHVHRPHFDPWLANGITPHYKYNYNDSGLGFMMKDKYQEKLNDTRECIAKKRAKKEVGNYPELSNLKQGDMNVIIEFCSDCDTHEGSTRHDESLYLERARSLRLSILRHFPIAKVIMKPIRTDPLASGVQKLISRQKIGAFEVIAASVEANGRPKKGQVHSKLTSGSWSTEEKIINEIAMYTGTCTLSFTLDLPFFDLASIPEHLHSNSQVNKLCSIQVQLIPRRFFAMSSSSAAAAAADESQSNNNVHSQQSFGAGMNGSTRQDSVPSRPASGMSRPVSGMSHSASASNFSRKAIHSDQISRTSQSGSAGESGKGGAGKIVGSTDKNGVVVFKDIPVDAYWIEIKETNNYRRFKQLVNIFELQKANAPLDLNLHLQTFNKSFLNIIANFVTQKDKENQQPLLNGCIKISILPKPRQEHLHEAQLQNGSKRDGEVEQQQQQDGQNSNGEIDQPIVILEEKFNRELKTILEPGVYLIEIQKSGYSQIEEVFTVVPGEHHIVFPPMIQFIEDDTNKQQSADPKARFQKRPSSSARRGILKSADQQQANTNNTSSGNTIGVGKSNEENEEMLSSVNWNDSQSNKGRMVSQESPKQKVQMRPTSSNSYQNKKVTVSSESSLGGGEKFSDEWSFSNIAKIKERDAEQLKAPKSSNEVKITGYCNASILRFQVITPDDDLVTESTDTIIIQNDVKSNKIGLWIKDSSKYSSGIYRIIASVDNPAMFNGQQLKVYASQKGCNTFLQVPYIDSTSSKGITWDIGIFDVRTEKFFEINNVSNVRFQRDWLLGEYESLLKYLNGSRPELKKILGFESGERVVYEDDVYVQLDRIISSLSNYEFTLTPEMAHFLRSAANPRGYYSFKKLVMKLIHKDLDHTSYAFIPQVLTTNELSGGDDDEFYDNNDLDADQAYVEDNSDDNAEEDNANFNNQRILANPKGQNILVDEY